MPRLSVYIASLMFGFLATASAADVSPQEVWENWQALGRSMGHAVTGDLEQSGNTLVVYDLTIKSTGLENDGFTITSIFPKISLVESGRGDVEISISESGSVSAILRDDSDANAIGFEKKTTVAFDGIVRAHGSPDAISYDIVPGTMTVTGATSVQSGTALSPEFMAVFTNLSGIASIAPEDRAFAASYDLKADAFSYDISGSAPDGSHLNMRSNGGPMTLTANGSFGNAHNAEHAPDLAAVRATATFGIGPATFDLAASDAAGSIRILGETDAMAVKTTLVDGQFDYTSATHGIDLLLNGSAIPVPNVALGVDNASVRMMAPVVSDATARPMALSLLLDQVRLPDVAWDMIDPQGQMPRAPASLHFDLSGNVIARSPLMTPATILAARNGTAPFQPLDISLNELTLDIAGARISSNGSAAFDTDSRDGPMGFPRTDAYMTFMLSGGMTLLDTLANGGLVPPRIIMSAKAMIGMFARQGDGPDTFVSDVTMSKSGAVTINGLPLPF